MPDVEAAVHRDGGRMTTQRYHVLSVITEAGAHLSAAEVQARLQTRLAGTAASTVYRVLQRLERLGLVHALRLDDEVRYGRPTANTTVPCVPAAARSSTYRQLTLLPPSP